MALKILLADDNLTAQRMGTKILAEAGHEVISVSNGAAAVKKIASEKPDLLILDVYMPGYSGLEVCAKVKAARETAALPVLLTVTQMEPFNPEEGNKVKADGVMIKPFVPSDLLAVVDKFARKRQATAAVASAPVGVDTEKIPAVTGFDDAGYQAWNAEAAPEPEHEAQPARMSVPNEMAHAPALGIDEMPAEPAVPVAAAPAWELPAAAPPVFKVALPTADRAPEVSQVPAPIEFEITPTPAFEAPIESTHGSDQAKPAEVAPPPEVEYTAAQESDDVVVEHVPELELSIEPVTAEPTYAQDPALVTTPEEMAQFVTRFGKEHPQEDKELSVEAVTLAAEPVPVSEVAQTEVSEPAAPMPEAGLDTVPIELLPELPEAAHLETHETAPEPAMPPQAHEAEPQPTPAPAEVTVPAPVETAPGFAVSAAGAAVAPAKELAPEVKEEPKPPQDELVAQFAEELEQVTPAQEAPVDFKPEIPAAAPLPDQEVNQERLVQAVNTVLDRYIAGFKAEIVNAIVRELKK